MANAAGIESTAKIRSVVSMSMITRKSGVNAAGLAEVCDWQS